MVCFFIQKDFKCFILTLIKLPYHLLNTTECIISQSVYYITALTVIMKTVMMSLITLWILNGLISEMILTTLQDTTNILEISKVMSEIDQSSEMTMEVCPEKLHLKYSKFFWHTLFAIFQHNFEYQLWRIT